MDFFLGIDGGGTSCKAAVADASGKELGRGRAGPANVYTDAESSVLNIVEASTAALQAAGLAGTDLQDIPAFLGLAGYDSEFDTSYLASRLPFLQCEFDEDSAIALQGAFGDGDGIVAVLGTGSVYVGRRAGKVSKVGGWGFMVGDLGSGARLGRALLQDTLLTHDRILPGSPLTGLVMSRFDDKPVKLMAYAQHAKPGDFAGFAPLVFEYAQKGDSVGQNLVNGAVTHVNAALRAIAWPGCQRLALLGGLADLYSARIDKEFREIIVTPKEDALGGAVQLALRRFDRKRRAAGA